MFGFNVFPLSAPSPWVLLATHQLSPHLQNTWNPPQSLPHCVSTQLLRSPVGLLRSLSLVLSPRLSQHISEHWGCSGPSFGDHTRVVRGPLESCDGAETPPVSGGCSSPARAEPCPACPGCSGPLPCRQGRFARVHTSRFSNFSVLVPFVPLSPREKGVKRQFALENYNYVIG